MLDGAGEGSDLATLVVRVAPHVLIAVRCQVVKHAAQIADSKLIRDSLKNIFE